MTELTQHGRAALERVAEWLESGAPHKVFSNGLEVSQFNMAYSVNVEAGCGTSCCIAGAVCQFEGLGLEHREYDGGLAWEGENGTSCLASEYLGIGAKDAFRLFTPWYSFSGPSYAFNSAPRGAAVIRHFLATGEVDWDKFNEDGSPYSGYED